MPAAVVTRADADRHADGRLIADGDGQQQVWPAGLFAFGQRQHRRYDGGRRVQNRLAMQVVHFHHVGGSAVGQRRHEAVAMGLTGDDGGLRRAPQITDDAQNDLDRRLIFSGDGRSEPV